MRGARTATKVMVLRCRYSPHGKCRAAAFKATGGCRIHRQLYWHKPHAWQCPHSGTLARRTASAAADFGAVAVS